MEKKQPERDTQWDEKDTTSGRPLMPAFGDDGASSFGADLPEGKYVKEMVQSRVAVNKVVDGQPPVRQEDGIIIVSVVEEKMVLVKKLVLIDEIHLERVIEDCEEAIPKPTPATSAAARSSKSSTRDRKSN